MMGKVIVEVLKGEKNMSESFGQWLNRIFVGKPQPRKELSEMTKLELEAKGREYGIELDRRSSKANLIKVLKRVMVRHG
jgi:hypothetical protein|tara:strand:- start:295 stop:531 length:237 start_codon:yes stop_codon:yes gene_type:complete